MSAEIIREEITIELTWKCACGGTNTEKVKLSDATDSEIVTCKKCGEGFDYTVERSIA